MLGRQQFLGLYQIALYFEVIREGSPQPHQDMTKLNDGEPLVISLGR